MVTVTIDNKGRILLPRALRRALRVDSGDVLYLAQDGQIVSLTKAENPFDRLAAEAVAEYYAGDTISLKDMVSLLDDDEGAGDQVGA